MTTGQSEHRYLKENQIGIYVALGNASLDGDNDAEYAVHKRAFEILEKKVGTLPCWHKKDEAPGAEGTICPYELCEMGFEFEEVMGKVAISTWFYSYQRFPQEDVLVLRDAAIAAYQEAAAAVGMSVQYLQTKYHKTWQVNESGVLEGV